MEITVSSNLNRQVFCPIRKLWVKATPEEIVRQNLLQQMIEALDYPFSYIAVEKELSQMPHVSTKEIPLRRADILCYGKDIHPHYSLYPLLLVECKAVKLTPKFINQVTGYNHFIQAYFVAVANQHEVQTGWYDPSQKKYIFTPYLPSFKQLTQSFK